MAANVEDILRTYNALKGDRQHWEPTWQAIADTMVPAFNDIQTYITPGQRRTGYLFDTTGLHGAKLLADHLSAAVSNFQMSWFDLRMHYAPLNDIKGIAVWCEAAGKTMQDMLSATTTPRGFAEKYRQFTGFGTGALFTDQSALPGMDGRHSLLSRSLPISSYVCAENADGAIDTLYREITLSPRQAIQYFGVDGVHPVVKEHAALADMAHTGEPYVHAVYPRGLRDVTREDNRNMAYASCYVDVTHKHICSEGGYRWFPYMVSRWEKLRAFSPYGFGPGHIALPEVLTLNLMDRDILKALQIHILPPYWTTDPDAVGRVSLLPGRINPIAAGATIEAMRGPGDFNISHLGMEERRQRIRQAFYMDQLLTLPPADGKTGQMTAYEVSQRVAYMQRLMGPAFMALLSEFLNPFIDIVFGLMLENDELPQPPDELIEASLAGFGKITVDYQGPLARAQKGDELEALEMTMDAANRYFQITEDTSIYDNIDKDEWMRRVGKIRGIPASVMRDMQAVERIRQERAEEQQAMQEQQAMIEGAKALGPAGQGIRALSEAGQQQGEAA